jgi:hypothetical protein
MGWWLGRGWLPCNLFIYIINRVTNHNIIQGTPSRASKTMFPWIMGTMDYITCERESGWRVVIATRCIHWLLFFVGHNQTCSWMWTVDCGWTVICMDTKKMQESCRKCPPLGEATSYGISRCFGHLQCRHYFSFFILIAKVQVDEIVFKIEVFNALHTWFGPSKYTSLKTTFQNASPIWKWRRHSKSSI